MPDGPEDRRTHLLNSAVGAIRAHGSGASMEQLAAGGGVTKPILYRHFGDRDGLVRAIGERYARTLMERVLVALRDSDPDDARATLGVTIDTFLEFLEDDPEVYGFLMRETAHDPEMRRRSVILEVLGDAITELLTARFEASGRSAYGVDLMAHGLTGMVHTAGDYWIRTTEYSRGQVATVLTDLLWIGFGGLRERDMPPGDSASGEA